MGEHGPQSMGGTRWWFARCLQILGLLLPLSAGGYFMGLHLWAGYHLRAAQSAIEHHDFTRAQDHLRQCLKVRRRNPDIHLLAAQTARRAGAYDEARQYLDDCESLQGPTPTADLERMLLNAQRGELDASVESGLWSLINHSHPETLLILEALSQGYLYSYRLGSAMECLQRWLERQPDSVEALLWRAQVWQALQHPPEALDDYRRAAALEPDRDEARLQLAIFLAFSGRTSEAKEHFERVWQHQPNNPKVLFGLALCHEYQGRPAEAARLLDALLRDNPQDLAALRERGKIALHQGQTADAEGWLRQCLQVDSHDQEATFHLCSCLQQQGKHEQAQQYQNQLKQIDADLKRLHELNQAVGKEPQNPALRHEAALICLRNGQDREALRWLTGALQVDPQHRPTHQTLADYYQRAGNSELAALHRQLAQ